jgi:hypothetical protein
MPAALHKTTLATETLFEIEPPSTVAQVKEIWDQAGMPIASAEPQQAQDPKVLHAKQFQNHQAALEPWTDALKTLFPQSEKRIRQEKALGLHVHFLGAHASTKLHRTPGSDSATLSAQLNQLKSNLPKAQADQDAQPIANNTPPQPEIDTEKDPNVLNIVQKCDYPMGLGLTLDLTLGYQIAVDQKNPASCTVTALTPQYQWTYDDTWRTEQSIDPNELNAWTTQHIKTLSECCTSPQNSIPHEKAEACTQQINAIAQSTKEPAEKAQAVLKWACAWQIEVFAHHHNQPLEIIIVHYIDYLTKADLNKTDAEETIPIYLTKADQNKIDAEDTIPSNTNDADKKKEKTSTWIYTITIACLLVAEHAAIGSIILTLLATLLGALYTACTQWQKTAAASEIASEATSSSTIHSQDPENNPSPDADDTISGGTPPAQTQANAL